MRDLFLGLMSGTSLDGIDVALVEFGGDRERPDTARLVSFRTDPYGSEFAARLSYAASGTAESAEICDLGFELGERFAES
ncbi:MAG: anhydro-N-acetylmuramic acid kinase, partial [Gemmatimonadota bacterium]